MLGIRGNTGWDGGETLLGMGETLLGIKGNTAWNRGETLVGETLVGMGKKAESCDRKGRERRHHSQDTGNTQKK